MKLKFTIPIAIPLPNINPKVCLRLCTPALHWGPAGSLCVLITRANQFSVKDLAVIMYASQQEKPSSNFKVMFCISLIYFSCISSNSLLKECGDLLSDPFYTAVGGLVIKSKADREM